MTSCSDSIRCSSLYPLLMNKFELALVWALLTTWLSWNALGKNGKSPARPSSSVQSCFLNFGWTDQEIPCENVTTILKIARATTNEIIEDNWAEVHTFRNNDGEAIVRKIIQKRK